MKRFSTLLVIDQKIKGGAGFPDQTFGMEDICPGKGGLSRKIRTFPILSYLLFENNVYKVT